MQSERSQFWLVISTLAVLLLALIYCQSLSAGSIGTGFFVSKNGYLITAQHVIDKGRLYFVLQGKKMYAATKITESIYNDLVLLKIDRETPGYLPISSESNGTVAGVFSYPSPSTYGYDLKYYSMTVWRSWMARSTISWSHTFICPGSSGGPVLNLEGEVIGVVQRSWSTSEINKDHCASEGFGARGSEIIRLASPYVRLEVDSAKYMNLSWEEMRDKFERDGTIVIIYSE